MQLRPFQRPDYDVCSGWFTQDDAFMPPEWLASAARAADNSAHHHLYVGCTDGEPVSIVSVSVTPERDRAVASLLVAPSQRRKGVACDTIQCVLSEFPDVAEFAAYVDPKNDASVAMMETFGFRKAAREHVERTLFVWRGDGTAPDDDWQPPQTPNPW